MHTDVTAVFEPAETRLPYEKLDWLNGPYIQEMSAVENAAVLKSHLEKAGYAVDLASLAQVTGSLSVRLKRLTDAIPLAQLLYVDELVELSAGRKVALTTSPRQDLKVRRSSSKICEKTYDQLMFEWKDKLRSTKDQLANLERDFSRYLDDLDVALILMTQMSILFDRLEVKVKYSLLEILINRIIVDPDGRTVDHELNEPFGYLGRLANDPSIKLNGQSGSIKVPFGVQIQNTRVRPSDAGLFLSELRFESQCINRKSRSYSATEWR